MTGPKLLHVDLTTGRMSVEAVDPDTVRTFIGGAGINNKLGYELLKPGVDPLSPENVIIFGGCTLGGTAAPASSRVMVTTRFPVNGTLGTGSGGSFGDALKMAGYGQVVLTGRSEFPVFLKVFDDDVEICDARDLWGRDIWETVDELRRRYGSECSIIPIGPAGERLSAISLTFANKTGHLGRGGLGAVMGAKNLKALLVRGRKGVALADRKAFTKIVHQLHDALMTKSYRGDWLGLGVGMGFWGRRSSWPQTTALDENADPYGPAEFQKVWGGFLTCPSCPVSCKSVLKLREGEHAGELVSMTGITLPMNWMKFNPGNLHRVYELADLCNRNGIDVLDVTGLMDLAVTLFEEGVISKEDTDGLELRRDYDTAKALLGKVVRREGLGDVMADGFPAFARAMGEGVEKRVAAITVKGHEPMFDPRTHFQTWNITEAVNPRSPWGQPGNSPAFQPGRKPEEFAGYLRRLAVPEDAIARTCSSSDVNMARLARYAEDYYSLCSCVGACVRVPLTQVYTPAVAAQLFTAATGFEMEAEELMEAGERSWTILKAMNMREGFSRKDDGFARTAFQPLVIGEVTLTLKDYYGKPLEEEDVEGLLDDYYDERGWDIETGVPTRQKLASLGLGWIADDLATLGRV